MLSIEDEWFIDKAGRKVLLRGINVGGSSKVPKTPNGATHLSADFTNLDVSFVGRPFPLKEAPTHFQRLRRWGFNALRLIVTWEAIEHSGPRQYDAEYLDYIEELLKIVEQHQMYTFIDPHQDLWSRASGGDGAPIWTFEKVGLDVTKFAASEAAFVMQDRYDPQNPEAYPPMSWLQNYGRFATCTMFTLFFGGNDFAPSCKIEGIPAQTYLQDHYIDAIKTLASRVRDNPYVVGFEAMNEPSPGWIGQAVDGASKIISRELFYSLNPFDAMVLAAGYPREIPYNRIKRFAIREVRRDLLNPNKVSCWLNGFEDIWQQHGVWGLDATGEPTIHENEHFLMKNGKPVDFLEDYLSPFVHRYATAIRTIVPDTIVGVAPPPEVAMRGEAFLKHPPDNSVNSSHWYDEIAVGLKRFRGWLSFDTTNNRLVLGKKNVQKMFTRQLAKIQRMASGFPTVIGEFGLSFDLNDRAGFRIWKKHPEKAWRKHIQALSMYYTAMDVNLLHTMLWNYTADNDNQWGDRWNQEDFSIFSRTQQTDPDDINSGGRAIAGFCRPHFVAVAGTPLAMTFLQKKKIFRFEFLSDPNQSEPTLLYIPTIHYPEGFRVDPPNYQLDATGDPQIYALRELNTGIHRIIITPV